MPEYEKLKSLNDLAEKMLSGLDEFSDHLLYRDDTYVKFRKQMTELMEKTLQERQQLERENENDPNIKLAQKELERSRKLDYFFHRVDETKKAMDALNDLKGKPDEYKQIDQNAFEYMLKMKMALGDIRYRLRGQNFVDAIDPEKLEQIFTLKNPHELIDFKGNYLGAMENIFVKGEVDERRAAARKALQNGTIQQRLQVTFDSIHSTPDDPKFYSIVSGKRGKSTDTVDEIIKSSRVAEVIKQYKEANRFWMGSALTDQEERESRRAFMECYEEELSGLYRALNLNTLERPDWAQYDVRALLEKEGIDGMMRDYHDMMLDRKGEVVHRFQKNDPWIYLYTNSPKEEIDFHGIKTKSTLYDPNPNPAKGEEKLFDRTSPQMQGLKDFHKWIYRNCDASGIIKKLGVIFGAHGSARSYMEDFMKAPYEQQIKTLYMLETKTRRAKDLPTPEQLKDYVPNLAKIKEVLVSRKYKVWQRLNGKKHRWNKIKECMDRLKEEAGPVKKLSKITTAADVGANVNKAFVITNYAQKVTTGIQVHNRVLGIGNNFFSFCNGVKKFLAGLTSLFGKNKEAHERWNGAADAIIGGASATGAVTDTADFIERAMAGVENIVSKSFTTSVEKMQLNSIVVVNGITTAVAVAKGVSARSKNRKHGSKNDELIKEKGYDQLRDEDPKKRIITMIQKHNHALKGVNRRKYMDNLATATQTGTSFAGGMLATGALGFLATAATAGTIVSGVGFGLIPIVAAGKNWYERYGYRRTIDTELFATEKEKQDEIADIRKKIERRLKRIAKNDSETMKELKEDMEKLKNSDDRLVNHIRKNVARIYGCVNQKQLRNEMLLDIGDDIYQMFLAAKEADNNPDLRDMKDVLHQAAENLVNLAGIKQPDLNFDQLDEKGIQEKHAKNLKDIRESIAKM